MRDDMTLARALPADLERCTSYRTGVTGAQLHGAIGRWVLWSLGSGGNWRQRRVWPTITSRFSAIAMARFGCSAGAVAARGGVLERHGDGRLAKDWQ
jgi:hypothetical protein